MKVNQFIDYKIVYSKRRSIGISVGPGSGIVVRAPYRTSLKKIENIVRAKASWINKHLKSHSSLISLNCNKEYIDGESHYFCGREYFLRIVQSEKSFIKNYENDIEIGLKVKKEKEMVKSLLEKWYKKMAEEIFRKKFFYLLDKLGDFNFSPTGFAVRAMKGRWGSCTSAGKITISTELVKLDEIFHDYVILHELCHLKNHNHSPAFYRLLSEVFPQWKNVRKELRKYFSPNTKDPAL